MSGICFIIVLANKGLGDINPVWKNLENCSEDRSSLDNYMFYAFELFHSKILNILHLTYLLIFNYALSICCMKSNKC